MATNTPSPISTPKRKRDEMSIDAFSNSSKAAQFTFSPNIAAVVNDSSSSPQSVTHRFRFLALDGSRASLESGGGVPSGGFGGRPPESPVNNRIDSFAMDVDMPDEGMRKRIKLPNVPMVECLDAANSADPADHTFDPPVQRWAPPKPKSKSLRFALDPGVNEQAETVANTHSDAEADNRSTADAASSTTGAADLQPLPNSAARQNTAAPSFTLPINTKAHNRPLKRAGTPPPPLPADTPSASDATTATAPAPTEDAPVITDPLRASLTWHDDEITIYDPDDSDDDGTGINGIGFKPTPAIAYARTVKRRQQLAEYRKREERDARAKRSQRRGGRVNSPAPMDRDMKGKKAERRRVRFMESVSVGETVSIEG